MQRRWHHDTAHTKVLVMARQDDRQEGIANIAGGAQAVVNSRAEWLSALKELVELPNKKRPERCWDAARAAITRATRSKKENVQ